MEWYFSFLGQGSKSSWLSERKDKWVDFKIRKEKQEEENAKPVWERTSQNLKEHWRYSEKNWEVHEWWRETAYDHLQCSFSCAERRTWMKKWTYRQKRDLLDKLEPWITALVQLISALAGAAVGIAICYFF